MTDTGSEPEDAVADAEPEPEDAVEPGSPTLENALFVVLGVLATVGVIVRLVTLLT